MEHELLFDADRYAPAPDEVAIAKAAYIESELVYARHVEKELRQLLVEMPWAGDIRLAGYIDRTPFPR